MAASSVGVVLLLLLRGRAWALGDCFLGVDCGTQSLKALVYDTSTRRVVGRGSRSYEPVSSSPSEFEQDPATWVTAMFEACAEALREIPKDRVRGMGVSGQQHGMVVLDAEGEPARRAKLWCDTSSRAEAAELKEKTGWPFLVASFTSSKLLWLKRREPAIWKSVDKVLLPHDYLNYVLTGEFVAEWGDASGTGLLDLKTKTWDSNACKMIDDDLEAKLPKLLGGPSEPCGRLRKDVAERLGLHQVLVSPGGGDNMMSAIGAGVTVRGRAAVSLGTSGTLFAKTTDDAPLDFFDADGIICPFLDSLGGGLPLVCTLNCANVPEEIRKAFGGEGRSEIAALAALEPPGSEGVTMLPYFVGSRTPNWPQASAGIVGLRPNHLARPGLLYRAALEAATYSLKRGVVALEKNQGGSIDQVRLVGGASKNLLWRQIVADVLQVDVAVPREPETAALGAAIQAAAVVALDGTTPDPDVASWILANHDAPLDAIIHPDPNLADVYARAFDTFLHQGQALFGGPGGASS